MTAIEFCPGTRFVQLKGRAIAVTPDDRVYLVANGRAVELVPAPSPAPLNLPCEPMRMPVSQTTGD